MSAMARIAAPFGNGARSDEVAALMSEAEAAAASASETADRARARALDPALSAKQVADARRQMDEAAFARAERDKLAAELADVYPAVEHLADLLTRIDANDRRIEYINGPNLSARICDSGRSRFAGHLSLF